MKMTEELTFLTLLLLIFLILSPIIFIVLFAPFKIIHKFRIYQYKTYIRKKYLNNYLDLINEKYKESKFEFIASVVAYWIILMIFYILILWSASWNKDLLIVISCSSIFLGIWMISIWFISLIDLGKQNFIWKPLLNKFEHLSEEMNVKILILCDLAIELNCNYFDYKNINIEEELIIRIEQQIIKNKQLYKIDKNLSNHFLENIKKKGNKNMKDKSYIEEQKILKNELTKFNITLVKGKPGSGKTLWVKSQILSEKNIKILYSIEGTYKEIDAIRINPVCNENDTKLNISYIELINFINVENHVIVVDDLIYYKEVQNLLEIVNILKPELFIKNKWYMTIQNNQDLENKNLLWLFDFQKEINLNTKELAKLAKKMNGN